jgi:hypothetical protein
MPRPKKTTKPTDLIGNNATEQRSDKREQLRSAWPDVFLTLAWTYQDGGGDLTANIIDSYLPSRTLELAHSCGLVSASEMSLVIPISEPVEGPPVFPDGAIGPDEEMMGLWCVKKTLKTELMRLLEVPIKNLQLLAATDQALRKNPNDVRWKEPTPAQHVARFLKLKHWSKVILIKKLSGIDDYVCETTKQFLTRLRRPPKTPITARLQFGIDSRTLEKLKALRSIMAANAPEQFGKLSIADLRWTPLDPST